MQSYRSLFRLGAAIALGSVALASALPSAALAQEAPAPAEAAPPIDPPARVGRLAALTGTVSFHTADAAEWQAATLNYPVTTGDAFWTEPAANAAIGLGDVTLVLDQQTEADVATLDDSTLALTVPQGAIYLHVRDLAPGTSNAVTTPRGVVTITSAGRYEVVAGDQAEPTRVLTIDGGADIAVGNVTLHLAARQAAEITGSDAASFRGSVTIGTEDAFVTAELVKEQQEARVVAQTTTAEAAVAFTPAPLVQHMTGYEELERVGDWQPEPQYGHVWFPPVAADYVPYRNGHWAFVAPWGWTWVDNAPWGFAPFHYGRWADFHGRWGWVPYDPGAQVNFAVARPVYAPALVSFIGLGNGVGVGVGLAIGASVGWVPLAPREPYYPPFRASPVYLRNVNVTHVTNVTRITNVTVNHVTINNYANARAATVVPAQAMVASRPIAQVVQHVTPQQLAAARPVAAGQAPMRPTLATAGVTPMVARQYHLAPAAANGRPATAAAPMHRQAPGPAFTPVAVHPAPAGNAAHPAPAVTAARPATARLPMLSKPGPVTPQTHMLPAAHPAQAVPAHPATEAAHPAERPALKPEVRPAPKPEVRPAPRPATEAAHPAERPALKPEVRPVPRPATEAAHPAERPTPKPEVRPAPHPATEAAHPAERPAPKPEVRPAPRPAEAHPAPKPEAHPAPKPEARPAPHPAEAHPAPKPEPKKCPDGKESC